MDYTPADATLVFNRETTTYQISIPIINDDIPEGDETFTVNLGVSDSSERNVTVDPAQALVVILYSELATPPECITSSIRLGDSDTGFEGRVEVCVNGSWSTVCDESWDYQDAVVTCTQLGLPSYGKLKCIRVVHMFLTSSTYLPYRCFCIWWCPVWWWKWSNWSH